MLVRLLNSQLHVWRQAAEIKTLQYVFDSPLDLVLMLILRWQLTAVFLFQ